MSPCSRPRWPASVARHWVKVDEATLARMGRRLAFDDAFAMIEPFFDLRQGGFGHSLEHL